MGEPILMGRVQFKPVYPEDLDLLPLRSAGDLFCASAVDGDCEDINKPAVSIRMGVIAFRRDNHDIRLCMEVVCCIVDTQCFVDRNLAAFVDISVENVFWGGLIVVNEQS